MSNGKESIASSFNFMESSTDRMWDMWKAGWEGLNWTADQLDNMFRKQMDQNKAMRDEWMLLTTDLSKQMRGNQVQYWNMVKEAAMSSSGPFNLFQYYTNLFKR